MVPYTEEEKPMNEVLDFDVPDELLPSDTYDVFVQEVEIREGEKGEYFAVTFAIAGGEHKNFLLYDNLSMSPKARRRLKRNLQAILGRELGQEPKDALAEEMTGRPCRVVVGQREFEGESRPDVTRIMASGSSKLFEGTEGKPRSKAVDDLFGPGDKPPVEEKPKSETASPEAPPAEAAPVEKEPTEEEIPF